MNAIDMLTRQTRDAYDWTNKIITSIPFEKWDVMPDVVESSVSWQVGHLLISFYYHSIMVVVGHQMDILQRIPLKDYDQFFTDAAPKDFLGKINPELLLAQLQLMEEKSLSVIASLNADDLEKNLFPSPIQHPVAKTKFEAIDWNIKHTMWHCGQLGILKRIVHKRYDFGLKRL